MSTGFDRRRFFESAGEMGDAVQLAHFDRLESTSSYLMEQIGRNPVDKRVVVASCQNHGRGRRGNDWYSENRGNLYLSISLVVRTDPATLLPLLPLAAGVSAVDALDAGGAICLKWPNDLMCKNRKLGGILCETPGIGASGTVAVIGMGVNLRSTVFPPELRELAISAEEGLGWVPKLERVAGRWCAGVIRWRDRIEQGAIAALVAAWRRRGEPFGRRVRVGRAEGVTQALNAAGRLVIRTDDGTVMDIPGGMVEHLD